MYGSVDALNAQMTELKRSLTLSEVQKQLNETHPRLVEYLTSVPDEQFASETRFRRRLRLDTYRHYRSIPRRSTPSASGQPEVKINCAQSARARSPDLLLDTPR